MATCHGRMRLATLLPPGSFRERGAPFPLDTIGGDGGTRLFHPGERSLAQVDPGLTAEAGARSILGLPPVPKKTTGKDDDGDRQKDQAKGVFLKRGGGGLGTLGDDNVQHFLTERADNAHR